MKKTILSLLLVFITSCTNTLKEHQGLTPVFTPEEFFSGEMLAWGMVQDYSGKLTRRFCVEIDSSWTTDQSEATGIIHEVFYYYDGEQQERTWTMQRRTGPGNEIYYTGTAGDVIGEARGGASGSAFNWKYRLDIPLGKGEEKRNIVFDVDDWIFLMGDRKALNRSTLSKFGLDLAEITIYFDGKNAGSCQENMPRPG